LIKKRNIETREQANKWLKHSGTEYGHHATPNLHEQLDYAREGDNSEANGRGLRQASSFGVVVDEE